MFNETVAVEREENVVIEEVEENLEIEEDEEMTGESEDEAGEESLEDPEERVEEAEASTIDEAVEEAEAIDEASEESLEDPAAKDEENPAKDNKDIMTEEEIENLFDFDKKEPTTAEISEELVEEENCFPDIDLDSIESIEHPTRSAVGHHGEASDIRVINTRKNGKRLVLKETVIDELNLTDKVQLGFMGNTLVMTESGISKVDYYLREQGKTHIIYNSQLVQDITDKLKLDFSKVTSIGLDIKYTTKEGQAYLIAKKHQE